MKTIVSTLFTMICLAAATTLPAQVQFGSLAEAKDFLASKTKAVSQPGIRYEQAFTYDSGKPGSVVLTTTSIDGKGKSVSYKTEFYLEHIDLNKILQVTTTKELKLEVFAKGDERLFRKTKDGKSVYDKSFDIFFDDMQMARDAKEALIYIIKNSDYPKLNFASENDAYTWIETNGKLTYSMNNVTYDNTITVDRTQSNRITLNSNETNSKGEQVQKKYEFYLADFNVASFRICVVKNRLGVNLTTTNNMKAVKYYENGIQKSFLNKFDMLFDDPKLSMDMIRAMRYIKTGKMDEMPVEKK
jgi:hypothetical protein